MLGFLKSDEQKVLDMLDTRNMKVGDTLYDQKAIPLIEKGINTEIRTKYHEETPLILACKIGFDTVIKCLLRHGANPNVEDKEGNIPLILAVSEKNYNPIHMVKLLLEHGANPNIETKKENTPLILAARYNRIDTVHLLIEKGANVNATNHEKSSALNWAAENGNIEIVKLLVDNGANVNNVSKNNTPLIVAIANSHFEVVKFLLENGVDINTNNFNDKKILHMAIEWEETEIVKLLIENGADTEFKYDGMDALEKAKKGKHTEIIKILKEDAELKNSTIETVINNNDIKALQYLINSNTQFNINDSFSFKIPLIEAIKKSSFEMIKIMIDNNADVNIQDKHGDRPLILAILENKPDIAKILIENGADINLKDKNGNTPSALATMSGRLFFLKLLVQKGANLNSVNTNNQTLLAIATLSYQPDIVKYLVDKNVDDSIKSSTGYTALMIATLKNYRNIVARLLQLKGNLEITDKDGDTSLVLSILKDHTDITKLLIENGADVNTISGEGKPVLHLAIEKNMLDIVKMLVENGADVNAIDNNGNPLLHLAIEKNMLDITKLLIEKGADVNTKDKYIESPLCKATNNKNKEIVEYLIENGADVNTISSEGKPVLHLAIEKNMLDIVKMLVENGADVNVQNESDWSPVWQATSFGRLDIMNYLVESGANIEAETNDLLILAAKQGHQNIIDYLLPKSKNALFKKVINKITLLGNDNIVLNIDYLEGVTLDKLGATVIYTTEYKDHFSWESKTDEVKKILGLTDIELIDNHDGKYIVKVYSSSNEAKLVNTLKINSIKPEFVEFEEENHTTYLLFKDINGVSIDDWNSQKSFIEDVLELPVDIEHYDNSHELWGKFGKEQLILIKESHISVMPDALSIGGKYLKTEIIGGYKQYYFTDIKDIKKWKNNKDKIIEFINLRVDILEENSLVILKESVEDSIPRLLDLQDSHKNYPKLYSVQEDGENKTYYYTFLPEIDLAIWKERSRKKNFRTLFNEPDKVYKLEVYDKANKELYHESFYTGQLIALHEYAQIPNKEDLKPIAIEQLKDENVFWGYATGSKQYYTPINGMAHMMVIGATGSGKSNFMNGIISSLLNSVDKIQKMYLIDLKSGIEFNRYKDLESDKIDVFSRGTKPSKLLHALYEVEAEMYLREEFMVNNNITKMDKDPVFIIIDEFAQIDLMYSKGEERNAKDEIFDTLLRIATRSRSANIKLIVQTQDPRSVPEDLKKHLMSRVLLKTGKEGDKEWTLQNPDLLDEQGIKHVNFDKGRYVFEDYNDGDTVLTELQFPFLDPEDKLHLSFKGKAQIHTEESSKRYEPYIQFVKDEYDYLEKTKILGGDNKQTTQVTTVEKSIESNLNDDFDFDSLVNGEEKQKDDFDFDSLLEEGTDQSQVEKDADEIRTKYNESKALLAELKAMGE